MDSLTKILKAAANKNRLRILGRLLDGKAYSIGEISEFVNLPYKTAARNLKILERFNYLKSSVNSAVTYYRINDSKQLAYNQLVFAMIRMSRKVK